MAAIAPTSTVSFLSALCNLTRETCSSGLQRRREKKTRQGLAADEMEMSFLLTPLTKKREVDAIIRDTLDKVLVLRFGRASDLQCLRLDDVLAKSSREVSKFATIALVDVDSEEIEIYVNYFDITLIPSTVFFFNAHHMKMDSGTADHTKWIGSFHRKQDFIDVVEALFRGAMKGKLIASCP